jgi:large subunit ribosomal protein L4
MPTLTVKTTTGDDSGTIDLADRLFGIEPNVAVMHQVVTAQLAAKRSGSQNTKTRSEVRGGGAKPWKQKGTGRARQGSIRAPHWRGGGVALGPKPRSYAQRTPKKMVRLALRSALSDRAAEEKVMVVEQWSFEAARTKDAISALSALGVDGRILVVVNSDDRDTWLSFRNLPNVHVIAPRELNAYDVLVADYVVFSRDTLPSTDAGDDARDARKAGQTAREAAGLVRQAQQAKAVEAKTNDEPSDSVADADDSADADDDEAYEGEEADMASDLPNREPSGDAKRTVIEPTDRVKSVADKEDPRFAAARKKADKEDRRRGARDRKVSAAEKGESDDEADAADAEAEKKPQSFSFNDTTKGEK